MVQTPAQTLTCPPPAKKTLGEGAGLAREKLTTLLHIKTGRIGKTTWGIIYDNPQVNLVTLITILIQFLRLKSKD
jgi:hypothetical protein